MTRRKVILPLVIFFISALSFQSCIGSFSLTNKVLQWNRNVSNKFVNELVFFAFWILPVYEVTSIADLLVINSIEFWSGNKPLEANNQVIETEHGNYQILASESGYQITSPDGNILNFDFNSETQSWSFSNKEGSKTEFLRFIDKDHVEILDINGEFVDVELSEDGINDFSNKHLAPFMALN